MHILRNTMPLDSDLIGRGQLQVLTTSPRFIEIYANLRGPFQPQYDSKNIVEDAAQSRTLRKDDTVISGTMQKLPAAEVIRKKTTINNYFESYL